jgi:hypothetical protein
MPNRILAIHHNNTDCLVHVFFTEENLTINILDHAFAEEIGFSSFTMNQEGKLVNSLSPKELINTDAALELYRLLLRESAEYLEPTDFKKKQELAKAG